MSAPDPATDATEARARAAAAAVRLAEAWVGFWDAVNDLGNVTRLTSGGEA